MYNMEFLGEKEFDCEETLLDYYSKLEIVNSQELKLSYYYNIALLHEGIDYKTLPSFTLFGTTIRKRLRAIGRVQ